MSWIISITWISPSLVLLPGTNSPCLSVKHSPWPRSKRTLKHIFRCVLSPVLFLFVVCVCLLACYCLCTALDSVTLRTSELWRIQANRRLWIQLTKSILKEKNQREYFINPPHKIFNLKKIKFKSPPFLKFGFGSLAAPLGWRVQLVL